MSVLANVPIWVYFIIMAITFMFVHVVAYDPNRVPTRNAGATTAMRIGSSVVLLIGLLIMQPAVPISLLLALGLSALGGFLSGRASPQPRRREPAEKGGDDEDPAGGDVDEGPGPQQEP